MADGLCSGRRTAVDMAAIGLSAVLPLALYAGVMVSHGVPISKATLLFDAAVLGYSAGIFGQFQRRRAVAVIAFSLVAGALLVACALKFVLLREWVRVSDLSLLDEAWAVLSWPERIAFGAVAATAVALAVCNVRRPRLRVLLPMVAPAILGAGALWMAPGAVVGTLRATTHAVYGNDPLYRSVCFALVYDVADRLAFAREAASLPGDTALPGVTALPRGTIEDRRNVHVFVLESFMDPLRLGLGIEHDPIDPRIRERIAGDALSPVFGGRTGQAEFELLCGTPAYDFFDPITFNDLRGEPIPCLPTLLRGQGYVTCSSSDVPGTFFNMRQAYRSIGFERSRFRADLPATDLDGQWVSARQRIAANREVVVDLLERGQPFLNYVLFVTGHFPYELDPVRRPLVLRTGSTDEVTRMVNGLYYNTRAVADYIDELTERDREAIIVVVGDHQGALPSVARESDWSRMFSFDRYRTPYVLIDGGVVRRTGDVAHYEIPHLILSCLQRREYVPLARRYGVDLIRPFGRRAFYVHEGRLGQCPREDDDRCVRVSEFVDATIGDWLRLVFASRPGGR